MSECGSAAHGSFAMSIPESVWRAALDAYDLSIQTDPRNTEVMRSRPDIIAAIRRDAMIEALETAFQAMGAYPKQVAGDPQCPCTEAANPPSAS